MISPVLGALVVKAVLALIAFELLAVWLWLGRTGRSAMRVGAMASLTAGAALMMAIYAAMTDTEFVWIALCLAVSGIAHLIDFRARWMESAR